MSTHVQLKTRKPARAKLVPLISRRPVEDHVESDCAVPVYREWSVIQFGKYKSHNLTLPELLLRDLDYFFYLVEVDAFRHRQRMEAAQLAARAMHIRPPEDRTGRWEFALLGPVGAVTEVRLVRKGELVDGLSAKLRLISRRRLLDLSTIRSMRPNKRIVNQTLVAFLKREYFPDSGARLTGSEVGLFFNDQKNFDMVRADYHTRRLVSRPRVLR